MKKIPLTQGKVALIDDKDFELVHPFNWQAHRRNARFYAMRRLPGSAKNSKMQSMHVLILGEKGVDHRDGDGLNNQRYNLRLASKVQNGQAYQRKAEGSTSRFRGVYWNSSAKKWQVQIKPPGGKQTYLGQFSDEVEAAKAYDAAAREHFGEFASPNFPLTLPTSKSNSTTDPDPARDRS